MKGFLRATGCFWFGLVLVSLIWSTSIDGMRDFIGSLTIGTYIPIWLAALAPGVILVYLSEKMPA